MGPGRAGSLLRACFSTDWIHPNKPSGELSKVYNKCLKVALQNPKVQQGSQFLFLNALSKRRLAVDRTVEAVLPSSFSTSTRILRSHACASRTDNNHSGVSRVDRQFYMISRGTQSFCSMHNLHTIYEEFTGLKCGRFRLEHMNMQKP
jgi:hypothetical protein